MSNVHSIIKNVKYRKNHDCPKPSLKLYCFPNEWKPVITHQSSIVSKDVCKVNQDWKISAMSQKHACGHQLRTMTKIVFDH